MPYDALDPPPPATRSAPPDWNARAFGGIARLYGEDGLARLLAAHVCVIGLGGVGSWAAEALARSGVGRFTLIDFDHVAPSNINRQTIALTDTLGEAKVQAMAARIRSIHPHAQVDAIDDFLTPANVHDYIVPGRFHHVLDCIDVVQAKAALAAHCRAACIPLLLSGAAGGVRNGTFHLHDLAEVRGDRLLARLRARLRRDHGYPVPGQRFGQQVVMVDSLRIPLQEAAARAQQKTPPQQPAGSAPRTGHPAVPSGPAPVGRLNCAGYGSSVVVTAGMGLTMAGVVLEALAAGYNSTSLL